MKRPCVVCNGYDLVPSQCGACDGRGMVAVVSALPASVRQLTPEQSRIISDRTRAAYVGAGLRGKS